MQKIIYLNIKGMHCAGCVNTLTNVLKRTPGVQNAKVSLELKKAKALIDERTPVQSLINSIKNAGYRAELE